MIPLMKSAFINEPETKRRLAEFVVQSPKFSMGEKCAEFEDRFRREQGAKDAILFNSGGSANLVLLQSLKNLGRLRNGSKVGFSALTWSTNVMPVIQMGMVPVPVDCTPEYLNAMSGNLLERLREVELDAFFTTNVLGHAGDLAAIRDICSERGIILIEDNCEALGSLLPEGRTGSFGTGATFSFFIAHHMSTVEGGMICTDDAELAEMCRIVRANGWDRNLPPERKKYWREKYGISEFQGNYAFYDLGFNVRPTEIVGFLGLDQIEYLEMNIAARERNYARLEAVVKENSDFVPIKRGHMKRLSSFAFPLLCKGAECRERYIARIREAEIEVRPLIAGNIQRQPFYHKYVEQEYDLPGAEAIHESGFYFGNYPELTESDLRTMETCLRAVS